MTEVIPWLTNDKWLTIAENIGANLNLDFTVEHNNQFLLEAILYSGEPDFNFDWKTVGEFKKMELWLNKVEGYCQIKYLHSINYNPQEIAEIKDRYHTVQMRLNSYIKAFTT